MRDGWKETSLFSFEGADGAPLKPSEAGLMGRGDAAKDMELASTTCAFSSVGRATDS